LRGKEVFFMLQVDMSAAVRTVFGKGAARRLRMNEITPAVLYGCGADSLPLQLDSGLLYKELFDIHGRNAVITLAIDGDQRGKRHVMVREIQKNPTTDRLDHVDFLEISLDKPMELSVPIHYSGKARGVEKGGYLHVLLTSVKLRGCLLDIPDVVEADITELDKGETGLTCGDLTIPENVELLNDHDTVCVTVY